MAEKDVISKVLEDYGDVFADIFNTLVFKRDVIREEELRAGATASQYKSGDGYRMQDRDIIKSWHNKSGLGICSLGAENQTESDGTMPVRVMNYDAAEYKRQLKHKERLHPVATIVLNFSVKRWTRPKTLLELMDVPEEVTKLVQDYKITVYDIAYLDDSVIESFRSDFRVVAKFFKHKRLRTEYVALQDDMELKHAEEVLSMLSAFTGDHRYEKVYEEHLKEKVEKGEKIAMCNGIQYWEDKGREEGREEGENDLVEAARAMRSGVSDEELTRRYRSTTIERARELLQA